MTLVRKWKCKVSANWRMCGFGLNAHFGPPAGGNRGDRCIYVEFLFWTLTVGVVNYCVNRGGEEWLG